MGKTYAKSLVTSYFTSPEHIYILDPKPIDDEVLNTIPHQNIFAVPGSFIAKADIIILAVKPQNFDELAPAIKPYLNAEQVVLSIMAGIPIAQMQAKLGVDKIVRSMPNLPAQIGMGFTVFTCVAGLDRKELFIVQNLLNTTGKSLYVDDESKIDAATAVSGSGPAYVYFFMQSMINTAIAMGFTKAEAELMVAQTFMGAVHLHNRNHLTCSQWIDRVASKGGTTEAALAQFDSQHTEDSIAQALNAAHQRAIALGS